MTFGRIIRSALTLASLVIVLWAFWNVTARAIARHQAQHDEGDVVGGLPVGAQISQEVLAHGLGLGRPPGDRALEPLQADLEADAALIDQPVCIEQDARPGLEPLLFLVVARR